jgi:hypothetical protein
MWSHNSFACFALSAAEANRKHSPSTTPTIKTTINAAKGSILSEKAQSCPDFLDTCGSSSWPDFEHTPHSREWSSSRIRSRIPHLWEKVQIPVIHSGFVARAGCTYFVGLSRDDWPLSDPKGLSMEQIRAIRDDVRSRVEALDRREHLDGNRISVELHEFRKFRMSRLAGRRNFRVTHGSARSTHMNENRALQR